MWIYKYLRTDREEIDMGPFTSRGESERHRVGHASFGAVTTESQEVPDNYMLYKGEKRDEGQEVIDRAKIVIEEGGYLPFCIALYKEEDGDLYLISTFGHIARLQDSNLEAEIARCGSSLIGTKDELTRIITSDFGHISLKNVIFITLYKVPPKGGKSES